MTKIPNLKSLESIIDSQYIIIYMISFINNQLIELFILLWIYKPNKNKNIYVKTSSKNNTMLNSLWIFVKIIKVA